MLALHATTFTLKSFHSNSEARVEDFFRTYANELPDDMRERFQGYGDLFIRRHARVQMSSLFKLMRAQCNKVITDVHTNLNLTDFDEEEDGIREAIEEAAGFTFEKPTAPASAALVSTNKRKATDSGEEPEAKRRGQSLSQILTSTEKLDVVLPDDVFDGVTTPDPLNNPISEPELSGITDEVLKFMGKWKGQCNIGLGLARIFSTQIRARVKLPNRGKKHIVLGADRDLPLMLVEKARNRAYKPVSVRD